MKYFVYLLVALLPFHALLVTFFKCKLGVPDGIMNVARMWKEIVILILLAGSLFNIYKKYKFNFWKALKNNYLVWTTIAFAICSFIYIFFPFFNPWMSSFLGYRYDVFFLFAMLIWIYLNSVKDNFGTILKIFFISTGLAVWIFLPWYAFGDISLLSSIFGYSAEVSQYNPNGCISYAQNTNGVPRFQWTFGGPIRFSVFLTTFIFVYLGYILSKITLIENKKEKLIKWSLLIGLPSLLYLASIYFSFSKTPFVGFIIGFLVFAFLSFRTRLKEIPKGVYAGLFWTLTLFVGLLMYIKRDFFLHIGSLIDRVDNLGKSLEMFFNNPVGNGLGFAGPASVVNERFWPENWFIQILLEQGIVWISLFVSIIIMIFTLLWKIYKKKNDYLSIGILTWFTVLVAMANLTHAFEESATSYTLFMIIGAYIAMNINLNKLQK